MASKGFSAFTSPFPANFGFRVRAHVVLLYIAILFISLNISAQKPVTLDWALTSEQNGTTTTETDAAFLNFSSGKAVSVVTFDQARGAAAIGWGARQLNPDAYFEYRIVPKQGVTFNLSEVSAEICISRGEIMVAMQYSPDGFRTLQIPIGRPRLAATTTPRSLSLAGITSVAYPDTLSIRIYGWGARDQQVSFYNRNVRIYGNTLVDSAQIAALTPPTPPLPENQDAANPAEQPTPALAANPDTTRPEITSTETPEQEIAENHEAMAAMAVGPGQDTLGGDNNGIIMAPMGSTVITASGTWQVPVNVYEITVECWGGGGGGGGARYGAGGGGGGGAYNNATYTTNVNPGDWYTLTIGAGGATGNNANGGNGGTTTFTGLAGTITANGGSGGNRGSGSFFGGDVYGTGGTGGSGGIHNGGSGGTSTGNGAGGGGGAGNNSNGNAGGNSTTGTGGTGNPNVAPYIGGNGGAYRTSNGNGNNATAAINIPGGGGGGARASGSSTQRSGGTGARGQVIITWPDCINPTIYNVTGGGSYCFGGTGLSITLSNSETGVDYELWRDGVATGTILSGNTGTALTFNNVTIAGIYTVVATRTVGGCTSIMNGSATITINPLPTITLGSNPLVCQGVTSANLPYTATTGSPNQYSIDYNPAAEAVGFVDVTNSALTASPIILTIPAGAPAAVYTGSLTIRNTTTGCVSTNYPIGITVMMLPVAPTSANSDRNNFCADDAGNISLSITGGAGTTIRWYTGSCGGTYIGTNTPLIIASPTTTTTYFARWETSGCGVSACAEVTVIVRPVPVAPVSVSSNINNICVNAGGNITLTAVGGSGTTLRWFTGSCGGTDIGTGNPLTIPSPTTTTTYYARWENNCGNSACASTTVTVIQLPVTPADALSDRSGFCADDAGNITLTAIGGSGATLRWFTGSCGGTEIGAVNPLTIPSPAVITTYYARWENSCGVSGCAEVTVDVIPLPVAPTSVGVDRNGFCYTDAGNIILTATGGSGNQLEWFTGSCGGTLIGTGNNLSLASPAITTTYYVFWINICGVSSCQSVTVTVNVVTPGSIAADQTICNGGNPAPFTSTTNGTGLGSLSYRWESSVSPFSVWNTIAGATAATYDPPVGLTVTTQYRRTTISDYNGALCESDPTAVVTVTVQSIPMPGQIAEDQYVCFGGSTALIYSVQDGTGDGTITYRWERSVTPFAVWTTIAGATAATYNPGPLAFTTRFRRITLSTLNGVVCESAASNFITITIQDVAVTAGSIGDNQTICHGETPANLFSVVDGTATAGATVSYEWQINTGAWAGIPGEFNEGLDISTPHILTTQYRRRTVATLAGNSCYSGWTVAVTITVIRPVTAGTIASNQTICHGETPLQINSITAGNSPGAIITYLWEQSTDAGATWNAIAGATTASYLPGPLTLTTWYRRITVATQNGYSCYSLPTNTVVITVQNVVYPGVIAASQTICYGAIPAPLTSVTPGSGSSAPAYTWEYSINNGINWTLIPGANLAGYAPGALTQTIWFRRITTCTVNGVNCSATSAHIVITVQGQVIPPAATANQTICYNTTPALLNRTNASGGSGNFTYQWQNSTDNVNFTDVGASGLTYQPPVLTQTTYYRVSATDATCGGPFYSNVVTITVRGQLVAPEICCDQIICTGASAEPITIITPPSGGSGSFSYQWEVSVDNITWNIIPGAILPVYTPSTDDRYYRLRVTDNTCTTIIRSNIVHVYTAFSLSANFIVDVSPGGQLCPGSSLNVSIESGNITVTNKYIRYSWTANPNYINPATGGPVGSTDCFLWIFCWHWADIPFTVLNTTNTTVTTDILVTPIVYYSNGTVNCILPTETISVTIRPFMLQCPANITANTTAGACTAQVPIPNQAWVANSCNSTVTWTMSGATVGTGTGNMGTRTFNRGVTTVSYSSTLNGQTTTCSFTVTVTDNQPPAITCPANIAQSTAPNQCTVTINTPNPTLSDNCNGAAGVSLLTWQTTGATTGSSPATGVNYLGNYTYNAGITTITYYAEDPAGNHSTCSFNVTITDNQAPNITSCPTNYTVSTDNGICTATFDPADPAVTDNCYSLLAVTWNMTGATNGNSPATGINFVGNTTFNPGITTITYTARDPGGNMATCAFTVSVSDNETPQFTFCPSGYSVNTVPGSCTATIATQNPEIFDNCGTNALTWSITGATTGNSGASGINYIGSYTFNSGTSTVTYTLTDSNTPPLSVHCSFDVTVTDTQVPVITCPGAQTRNTVAGGCIYPAQGTEFDPAYSENCLGFSISNNLTGGPTLAGYAFPLGTTNVLWVIIDASGNQANCNFNVTVVDNQTPEITTCAPAQTANAGASCQAAIPDVTGMVVVTDNCTNTGDFTITQSPLAGVLVGVGVTTITITVRDENGLSTSCQTTFTVSDNTAPVFAACPANPVALPCNPASLPDAAMAIAEAGTATDNCVTPSITATGGTITNTGCAYTQIWTVTASDGTNPANCLVSFNWTQDNTAPVISTTASNINLGCNPTITAPIFTGTDNCEGSIIPVISSAGPTNTGCVYSQTWTANYTDACGNVASPVNITYTWTHDTEEPLITTAATSSNLGCNPIVTAPTFTGTDNCEGTIIPVVNTSGPANTACNYSQTWTATYTDACGNPAIPVSITYTWTQDNELPVISTTAASGALPGCNPSVAAPIFTGTDNCEGSITPVVNTSGPANTACDYSQTWSATYTDACGNTAIAVSITYTWVQDTQQPAINCTPGSLTVPADAGETYASGVAVPTPATSDNCSGAVTLTWVSSDPGQGSGIAPFPVINTFRSGTTTITWTAEDACNNESSCTFTVTVTANDPPDITCAANINRDADAGLCSALVNPEEPTVNAGAPVTWSWEMTGATTDNGIGPIDDYTFPVGTTTIAWTATNTSGTDVCMQTIAIEDNEAPVFSIPTIDPGYCVEGFIAAVYNPGGAYYVDDLTPERRDYYILTSGNTLIDLTGLSDNCPGAITISWSIDFGNNATIDETGLGQISLSTPVNLPLGDNLITWTVTDANSNTETGSTILTVLPRPEILD